jgi:hypothetical protein
MAAAAVRHRWPSTAPPSTPTHTLPGARPSSSGAGCTAAVSPLHRSAPPPAARAVGGPTGAGCCRRDCRRCGRRAVATATTPACPSQAHAPRRQRPAYHRRVATPQERAPAGSRGAAAAPSGAPAAAPRPIRMARYLAPPPPDPSPPTAVAAYCRNGLLCSPPRRRHLRHSSTRQSNGRGGKRGGDPEAFACVPRGWRRSARPRGLIGHWSRRQRPEELPPVALRLLI